MKFHRAKVRCQWTGCTRTTTRIMDNEDPVRQRDGRMVGTTIILCETHLKRVMDGLRDKA
jgi:hypothetical protein